MHMIRCLILGLLLLGVPESVVLAQDLPQAKAAVEGRLIDAKTAAPLADVQVLLAKVVSSDSMGHTLDMSFDATASPDRQKVLFGFVNLVNTDPQGRFRFTEVPSGSYGLVGFLKLARIEIIDVKSDRPLDIRVDTSGRTVDLGTIRVR